MNFDNVYCESYFLSLMFFMGMLPNGRMDRIIPMDTTHTRPCGFDSVYIDSQPWAEQRQKDKRHT